jgi:protease-4
MKARGLRALAVCLGAACALGCEGRPRSATGSGAQAERSSGPSIAVLDLSEGLPEQSSSGILGLAPHAATLDDLIEESTKLAGASEVKGILVRLGSSRIGLERADEVSAVLADLRAKRPVWCHADDLGNATLALAAKGCSRIWVSPASTVDAVGVAAQTIYFHKLLADEVGLDVDVLQVGKYKGAEEPFTRDGPSPEARQSLESTLAGLRSAWLEGVHKGRADVAEAVFEDGPYAGARAKELGLVDDVGYFDEARDALEKSVGAVRAETRLGPGAAAEGDDLGDVLREAVSDSLGSAPVAIVPAVGPISMESSGSVVGESNGIVARKMLRVLSRLEKDDDVKAVVLRIDSPGGSALASDLLWHALMRIRARKTLVVSIGGMAASGGYYMASAGAAVLAGETSIVGSIGVVGGKISADRALAKIGVHAETFSAKPGDEKAESRAAYESFLKPWDDATRARMLETMTNVYQLFLARVAEGRGISVDKVAESAEGRIFSGKDGKARGLVDAMGGLREALARARTLAGLPADARVSVAGEPAGFLQTLVADEGADGAEGAGGAAAARSAFVQAAAALAPETVRLAATLAPLAGQEHVLCAMPFALTVQ